MRVVVVEPSGKGGMIHYAWQLCQAMAKEGTDVTLLTDRHYELGALSNEFTLKRDLRLWDPKPLSESRSTSFRRARRGLRALVYYREWIRTLAIIRRLRPDVVQLGDVRFATDLLPIRLLRSLVPVMADVCHNLHPFSGGAVSGGTFESSRLERSLYERVYRLFDAVFVHYGVNAEEFAGTFPASADAVVPIVHGNEKIFSDLAATGSTAARLREQIGLGESQRVILFFGTLSLYKGLDLLLDAFEQIVQSTEEAVLVLAGFPISGFDPEAYQVSAQRRGLGDRLRIVDRYIPSEDVEGWMKLADVAVFPYRSIYQSGALQLAQTFGVPIVATRVGAMPEVIRDGETGLLVEPDSAAPLAAAILRLLDDRGLAQRLGSAARNDAEKRFSWTNVARTMLATYERLMRGARK